MRHAGQPLGGVDQQGRLEDLAGPLAIAAVDPPPKQERAGGVGQRPQTPLWIPRTAKDGRLVGERLEAVLVRAAAALRPADEVGRGLPGAGGAREPAQGFDPAGVVGIRLHDRQPELRRGGHAVIDLPDRHRAEGQIGDRDDDRRRRDGGQPPIPSRPERGQRRHDGAGGREHGERARLGAGERRDLDGRGPGELRIAELPGKHPGDHRLGHHRDESRGQPGLPRIAAQPPHDPEGQRQPAGVPEHDRHREREADELARPHRVGEHLGRPVEGQADREHGRRQHGEFAAPSRAAGGEHQSRRDAEPAGGNERFVEPRSGHEHGGGDDGGGPGHRHPRRPRCRG